MYRMVKAAKICSSPRIFETFVNCLRVQKENTKHKSHMVGPCRTKQQKQSFEFWNLKTSQLHKLRIPFSMKLTMSSVNLYLTFYRNIKIYSKSLKHTSFSTWFDSSRIPICCIMIIIVTSTKNG